MRDRRSLLDKINGWLTYNRGDKNSRCAQILGCEKEGRE
jgi:hypothetical protein